MDTKMRCKCGNCVPVKEMKYDINGTDLICGECYRYQQLRFKEKVFGKSYNKIETITGKKRDTVDTRRFQEEKIKYFCENCHYKFSRKKDFKFNLICPNCGKTGLRINNNESAQKLIDTIGDWEENRILKR
ncbi:hypothetical protein J4436_03865 [Candidatus Woesearchaeota archaeon]|nr:hypothetical protein [Candidatus Woesearchaeota archaeon]